MPLNRLFTEVRGSQMAYLEAGTGDPIIFLHGNPTSSYLWRNIIPFLEEIGWCIAPDLIGMGYSDKLPEKEIDSYKLVNHIQYLNEFLEKLNINQNVVIIAHDWGGPLAFNWLQNHPEAAKGVSFMETIVTPMSWNLWPAESGDLFKAFRSPAGEKIILEKNVFVERVLPASIIRDLTDTEMEEYRKPFLKAGESRRPTLTWPRELPIDGTPSDTVKIIEQNDAFMTQSKMPKLFINAEPGAILTGDLREHCLSWPNTTQVTVKGRHFIQEDSPYEIGQAIAEWYLKI